MGLRDYLNKKIQNFYELGEKVEQLQDVAMYSGETLPATAKEFNNIFDKLDQEYPNKTITWKAMKAIELVEDKYISEILVKYEKPQ